MSLKKGIGMCSLLRTQLAQDGCAAISFGERRPDKRRRLHQKRKIWKENIFFLGLRVGTQCLPIQPRF